MIRALPVGFAVFAAAAALIAAGAPPASAQLGYDRPGGDYAGAAVASGDPAVCAARCEHDAHCRAWSFSYPPAAGGPAMCFLKHEVRPGVKSSCCVSGVRGAAIVEPPLDGREYSIDRVGGDYRSFEAEADPNGDPCAEACKAEPHCRAWTYRRSGYGTAAPRCYLKSAIKPPRHKPCCISGVVR